MTIFEFIKNVKKNNWLFTCGMSMLMMSTLTASPLPAQQQDSSALNFLHASGEWISYKRISVKIKQKPPKNYSVRLSRLSLMMTIWEFSRLSLCCSTKYLFKLIYFKFIKCFEKSAADYDSVAQSALKIADPEVSPGLWEGDIAGLEPEVSHI